MKTSKLKYDHGFIGIGKMGQVILQGLLKSKLVSPKKILVSRRSSSELKKLKTFKVATTHDNREVAQRCRWLWLGIKPFQSQEVLAEIAPQLQKGTILISMMAGISTKTLKTFSKNKITIIRLMPNTPAMVGVGMTGIYFAGVVSPSIKKNIFKILKTMGEVLIATSEEELDAVTGLSGSGPAFVYQFTQGLIEGGIQSGLSPIKARQLALETVAGAIKMLQKTKKTPDELITQVVSKGGTTEAGLQILANAKMKASVAEAVKAAAERAEQIRKENETCTS